MDSKFIQPGDIAMRGPDLFLSAKFQTALETLAGKAAIQIGGSAQKDDKSAFTTEAIRPDWRKGLALSRQILRETPDLRLLVALLHSILADQSQPAELATRIQHVAELIELVAELVVTRWQFLQPTVLDDDGQPDGGMRIGSLALLGDRLLVVKPMQKQCDALYSHGFENGWNDAQLRDFVDRVELSLERIEEAVHEASPEDKDFRYGELREALAKLRGRLPSSAREPIMHEPEAAVASSVTGPLEPVFSATSLQVSSSKEADAIQGLSIALQFLESTRPDSVLIGLIALARSQASRRQVGGQRDLCVEILEHVAKFIENTEPSSPVPLLVRRAISIHGKSFLDLLNAFGGSALTDMLHESKLIPKQPADLKPPLK